MKRFLLIAAAVWMSCSLKAQTTFSGEIRPRAEYRDGYKTLPDTSSEFAFHVSQRSRLSAIHKAERVNAKISLQDVRIWGEKKQSADIPSIGLFEAWFEVMITDSLSAKIGRQEIPYDDERIFSRNNWNQNGSSHDLLVLKHKHKGWSTDVIGGFNQNKDMLFGHSYTGIDLYKTLTVLRLHRNFGTYTATVMGIADGYQKQNTQNTLYMKGTYGAELSYKRNKFSSFIRYYYQNGKTQTGQNISAWFANAWLSYALAEGFDIKLGAEVFSGNDATDTTNKNYNAFSLPYCSNHAFMGFMDYFGNPATSSKGAGLTDIYVKFDKKFADKNRLRIELHQFSLQNNYLSNSEIVKPLLGYEADFIYGRAIGKTVNLEAGYCFMLPTPSMQAIKGGRPDSFPHWAYLMLTYRL